MAALQDFYITDMTGAKHWVVGDKKKEMFKQGCTVKGLLGLYHINDLDFIL